MWLSTLWNGSENKRIQTVELRLLRPIAEIGRIATPLEVNLINSIDCIVIKCRKKLNKHLSRIDENRIPKKS